MQQGITWLLCCLQVLISSMASFASIVVLLVLFWLVFSIVGLHVFGGLPVDVPFPNCDTLINSLILNFHVSDQHQHDREHNLFVVTLLYHQRAMPAVRVEDWPWLYMHVRCLVASLDQLCPNTPHICVAVLCAGPELGELPDQHVFVHPRVQLRQQHVLAGMDHHWQVHLLDSLPGGHP
jgi:hypothetical protein